MQSIRSGHGQSAITELKEMFSVAADPKKLKEALDSLDSKLAEVRNAEKVLSEKAAKESAFTANYEKLVAEADAVKKALSEKEARLLGYEQSLKAREQRVAGYEKEFAAKKADFETFSETAKKTLDEALSDSAARKEALEKLKAEGEELVKVYEAKVKQLKAVIG